MRWGCRRAFANPHEPAVLAPGSRFEAAREHLGWLATRPGRPLVRMNPVTMFAGEILLDLDESPLVGDLRGRVPSCSWAGWVCGPQCVEEGRLARRGSSFRTSGREASSRFDAAGSQIRRGLGQRSRHRSLNAPSATDDLEYGSSAAEFFGGHDPRLSRAPTRGGDEHVGGVLDIEDGESVIAGGIDRPPAQGPVRSSAAPRQSENVALGDLGISLRARRTPSWSATPRSVSTDPGARSEMASP